MDKNQVLSLIKQQLQQGTITNADLATLAGEAQPKVPVSGSHMEANSRSLVHVLYAIGAIIAVIGVIILLSQHWREIGSTGRVLVTLGLGLATYIAGMIFRKPEQNALSQVLFVVSALLTPSGIFIWLTDAHMTITTETQILVSAALAVVYFVAFLTSRKNILAIIFMAFATWFYYALIYKFVQHAANVSDIARWATIIIGLVYILIGKGYEMSTWLSDVAPREKKSVTNILIGVGTLAILGAAFTFGGIFDLLYILVIFAAFYGSVYLKSTAVLVFASLFLVAHIVHMSSKYFVNSIGWPVALIATGFLVIGIGYFTLYLNRKYIRQA